MGILPTISFPEHFVPLSYLRRPNARHQLSDILVIAICAVICDAKGGEDIEEYDNTTRSRPSGASSC